MIIDPESLAALTAEIAGPVLVPGDERYPEETATWNLALAHHPVVAVGATCADDVRAAIRFAAANALPVAVVATGHGAGVPADGAVLINMRRMDGITVDARQRTATVGAAVEMQSLVEAAAEEGLAPLAGSSPSIGVVGYTLGGGLSPFLGRLHGYAADHVVSAEIVTADGDLHRIDTFGEPDLFWAIRGGKGNFGVVTALTVSLFPVTEIYGGSLYFAGEHARAVVAAFREIVAVAPEELTVSLALLRLPPLPSVPGPLRGRFCLHVRVAYAGPAPQGERLIANLRAAAPALMDTVETMPFTAVAAIHADPVEPFAAYEVSAELADFPPEAADALLACAGPDVALPVLMVEIRHLGGALARAPRVPNVVEHRAARFHLLASTAGDPGMETTLGPGLNAVADALGPWATGRKLISFLTGYDVTTQAVAAAYPQATFEHLRRVKAAYDPANMFRLNHNIAPLS
jgi:FAD/FMN-containing dehydrogenase